jgi:esterase/lipase superfamily enzyme
VVLFGARTNNLVEVWPASLARWLLLATLVVALGACVARPGSTILEPAGAKRGDRSVTIFLATLRTPEPGLGAAFNSVPSEILRFARYVISIPPTHRTDEIEWPGDPPDPATDFGTIEAERLSEAEFRSVAAAPGGRR